MIIKKHQKTLKSLLRKTMEGEDSRLQHDIQNHVPAVIDHTNIAFLSIPRSLLGLITAGTPFQHFHFDTLSGIFY
jgi:hypothetical protein